MGKVKNDQQFRKLFQAYPAKAIEMLYAQNEQSLKKLALKLTGDALAAEDIVQDSILVVLENYKELAQRHETSIERYLIRIVRNKSITFFKQKLMHKLIHFLPLHGNRNGLQEKSIETDIIELEWSQTLRAAVETFPRRERECLLMRIDGEMPIRDIAEKLQLTPKAIERSLTSARKRLRKHWQRL